MSLLLFNSQCAERNNRVTALPLSRVVDFKKSIKLKRISFCSSVQMGRDPVEESKPQNKYGNNAQMINCAVT